MSTLAWLYNVVPNPLHRSYALLLRVLLDMIQDGFQPGHRLLSNGTVQGIPHHTLPQAHQIPRRVMVRSVLLLRRPQLILLQPVGDIDRGHGFRVVSKDDGSRRVGSFLSCGIQAHTMTNQSIALAGAFPQFKTRRRELSERKVGFVQLITSSESGVNRRREVLLGDE